ncbi:MAG: PucR family transcriptional regulator ligand-binding domain-containing protein [Clostridia bacterium]|jgi:purine catabolism regulator|nr:PucR family transcriptional regulator ligand-binding domain-containing protein [Clostridia bacterium]
MGISVRDALKIGALANARLVAGVSGLDREIEHITMMEVPEAVQWIKGHDLVLASSFALAKQRSHQASIIQSMAASDVAALVVKNQSFLEGVSSVMIDVANVVGLPILEVSSQVDYSEIIRPLMEEIINKESAHICRKIAEMTMIDNTLEEKLIFLEHLWHFPSAIVDNQGIPLAQVPAGWLSDEIFDASTLHLTSESTTWVYQGEYYYAVPLSVNNQIKGHWIMRCGSKSPTVERQEEVANIVPVILAQMGKQKSLDDVKARFSGELLEDLISGHIQSLEIAKRRAELLGLKECPVYTILVVHMKNDFNKNESNVERNWTWPIYFHMPGEVLAAVNLGNSTDYAILLGLSSHDELYLRNFCDLFYKMLISYGVEQVFFGVGETFEELTYAGLSFGEAKEAMQIGRFYNKDEHFIFFKEMGIYRLLAQINDDKRLLSYVPKGLLRLQAYDIHSNIDLISTLASYLKNAGNARRTAEEMFVHYKTLQYRLDRIGEISGLHFDQGEQRLEYYIGLKILDILKAKNA